MYNERVLSSNSVVSLSLSSHVFQALFLLTVQLLAVADGKVCRTKASSPAT